LEVEKMKDSSARQFLANECATHEKARKDAILAGIGFFAFTLVFGALNITINRIPAPAFGAIIAVVCAVKACISHKSLIKAKSKLEELDRKMSSEKSE
jgi:cobalamin biosynthesis protein CobD/CbiB